LRILYVEDNPELRDTICLLMEAPGRDVVACASAEEALAQVASTGPFDLVVTDVTLPGMSGTEMCRKLLADDAQQRIVLCSGYQMHDEIAALGPQVRTLAKPFGIDELEALLDSVQAEVQGAGVA